MMFWVETLNDLTKYCSCQGGWVHLQIINAYVEGINPLEVYMTPEDGNRCLVYRLARGRPYPNSHYKEFMFSPWGHVRIEVFGGEITIAGVSDVLSPRYKATGRHIHGCPFGNEEDWAADTKEHMLEELQQLQSDDDVKEKEKKEKDKEWSNLLSKNKLESF